MLFAKLGLGWLSDGLEKVSGAALKALRSILFRFCSLLYQLVINLYNMFNAFCSGKLLNNSVLDGISNRIGLIVGLIMLFYVLIGFVKLLVDPEKITDNKIGAFSIVKRILIVIVMLGVSRFAFEELYAIQVYVVSNNVIGKLLVPYTVTVGEEEGETYKFGGLLAEEMFSSFYYIRQDITNPDDTINSCEYYMNSFKKNIIEHNEFDDGEICLNDTVAILDSSGESDAFIIHANWLMLILCGGAMVYLLFMYCFKVGIRMLQMMFLEIISPAPIISYLSPDSKMFNTWIKIYFSTYIDIFIRVGIINFSVFLIATIFNSSNSSIFTFWSSVGDPQDFVTRAFFTAVIILAILVFANKAPDLIKQLLPEGSASKLGFAPSLADFHTKGLGTSAVGAVGGAAVGLLHGNAIGGAIRGFRAGSSADGFGSALSGGGKAEADAIHQLQQRLDAGGSRIILPGERRRFEKMELEYKRDEEFTMSFDAAKTKADSEVEKHLGNDTVTRFLANGHYFNRMSLAQLEQAMNDDTRYDDATRSELKQIYQKSRTAARNLAMRDGGAADSGQVAIDFARNTYTYSASAAAVAGSGYAPAANADISANMDKVLSSSHAGSTGDRFEDAKTANDYHEAHLADKINDAAYIKGSANNQFGGSGKK